MTDVTRESLAAALRSMKRPDAGWPGTWRDSPRFGIREGPSRNSEEFADAILASLPSPAPEPPPETAWLIERGQPEHQVPTVWWAGNHDRAYPPGEDWTTDANDPSREEAEAAIELLSPIPRNRPRFGRATEHVFFRRAAQPAPDPEGFTITDRGLFLSRLQDAIYDSGLRLVERRYDTAPAVSGPSRVTDAFIAGRSFLARESGGEP